MRYIALETVAQNVERVAARADAGGHSAPAATVRLIRQASLRNLPRAPAGIRPGACLRQTEVTGPRCVLEANRGRIVALAPEPETPRWLEQALDGTPYTITVALRDELRVQPSMSRDAGEHSTGPSR